MRTYNECKNAHDIGAYIYIYIYIHIHTQVLEQGEYSVLLHDGVMPWQRFLHFWHFIRGFIGVFPSQRDSNANLFPLVIAWTSCWTKSPVASDLRPHDIHVRSLWCYNVTFCWRGARHQPARWESVWVGYGYKYVAISMHKCTNSTH